MHIAMQLPMNHAHTAVAGPPAFTGLPKVAGTEPSTPRIEMAYETVDHLLNSRLSSCPTVKSMLQMGNVRLVTNLLISDSSEQALVVVLNGCHSSWAS